MSRLVASHLVDGVVDGVETFFLCPLGKLKFALGGAILGIHTHLKVLLGRVGQNFAEELRELGGVLRLLKGSLLPISADLGITLAVRNARHRKVHTYLAALAFKIGLQAVINILGATLGNAENVLRRPSEGIIFLFAELTARHFALGAKLGRNVAFVNVTAYGTNPFSQNTFFLLN